MALNQKGLDVILKTIVSTGNMLTLPNNELDFYLHFSTLWIVLELPHTLQRNKERYKKDFDRPLCNAREMIRTGDYVFTDISDGVSRTSMLEHAVDEPNRVTTIPLSSSVRSWVKKLQLAGAQAPGG